MEEDEFDDVEDEEDEEDEEEDGRGMGGTEYAGTPSEYGGETEEMSLGDVLIVESGCSREDVWA